jgi:hypothetical protein
VISEPEFPSSLGIHDIKSFSGFIFDLNNALIISTSKACPIGPNHIVVRLFDRREFSAHVIFRGMLFQFR